jgi:hypothetical protein
MNEEPRNEFLRLALGFQLEFKAAPPKLEKIENSDIWCWHCCHPFSNPKVVLPVSYDEVKQLWKTTGAFCSWACAKAYNMDSKANYNNTRGQLLALLKKKMTGKLSRIVPAPPRMCLRVFGGTMSIDEFREKSTDTTVTIFPPKMIPFEQIIHERKIQAKRDAMEPGPDLQQSLELAGSGGAKNETLRLKRPRPMPSSSDVLARTMGLEIS